MSGGFFRGTSADQDTRFSNKQAKLLKTQKFASELEHLVDITKVKMDVIKPWIARRVTELIGIEDEVLINFIYGLLDAKEVNGKNVQIQLTGFMEKNTGKFMKELWALLLSAQNNASGVPQQFLDAKEEETRKKKEETDRIFNEIQRRKEKETEETEHKEARKMDGGLNNNSAEESLRRPERGSGTHPKDENGAGVRNGFRGTTRSSKSPYSSDRSPSPHRAARSRSISKSFSSPRGRSKERSLSRSISRSPRERRRSYSPEKICSPRRRSITPMRRSARESISPRQGSRSRRRSSSRTRRISPSPLRRRVHSPVRYRRSPSPRRRSPVYARRRSPYPRSRSPLRRRSPPRRYRSPSPRRHLSRRSPTHRRRRRSASSSRSRSPVRRRPLSPYRRRYESPRRRSAYPSRRRSPTPNRRPLSPYGRKSRSPQQSRSSSPLRSPGPAHKRSPGPARKRYPAISPRQSQSSTSGSSISPVRHGSVSPVKKRSHRVQESPQETPGGNTRTREVARIARMDHRQLISLSPQRDAAARNSPRRKVPQTQTRARSRSPSESPYLRAEDQKNFDGGRRTPDKLRDRKSHHVSPVGTDESMQNSREDGENYSNGKRSLRSSGDKNKESPDKSFNQRHNGSDSRKDNKMRSEEGYEKEAHFSKKSPRKGSLPKEASDVPHAENMSKSEERRSSHPKAATDNIRTDSLLVDPREKIERNSPSVGSDSGVEEGGKRSARVVDKRKHRRSTRRDETASDDSTSDSEMEGRKEAKRRRKEEKKLRKEERKRRREERRRRKEDKRASRRKRKSKDSDISSSDTDKDENKVYGSIRERGSRKYSSDEETESQKKRLENELREKAIESLRAKKGIISR